MSNIKSPCLSVQWVDAHFHSLNTTYFTLIFFFFYFDYIESYWKCVLEGGDIGAWIVKWKNIHLLLLQPGFDLGHRHMSSDCSSKVGYFLEFSNYLHHKCQNMVLPKSDA